MNYFLLKSTPFSSMGLLELSLSAEEIESHVPVIKFIQLPKQREDMIIQDYLTTNTLRYQYHLVSDGLKTFISPYMWNTSWTPVILIDENQKQILYWFLRPPVLNAIHSDTTYDIGKAVQTLVLDTSKLHEESIFSIQTPKQTLLLFGLNVVEGILRREFYGLHWIRVEGKREK